MANELEPTNDQLNTEVNETTLGEGVPTLEEPPTEPEAAHDVCPEPFWTPFASLDTETPEPEAEYEVIDVEDPATAMDAEASGELIPMEDSEVTDAEVEPVEEVQSVTDKVAAIGRSIAAGIVPARYWKVLDERRRAAFDPEPYEDDEVEAEAIDDVPEEPVSECDITMTHAMPVIDNLWEQEPPVEETAPQTAKRGRLRMVAAFAAVAITSFVAGGVVSRMSSQMPVLVGHITESTENVASLSQKATPVQVDAQKETPDANETSTTDTVTPAPQEDIDRQLVQTPQERTDSSTSDDGESGDSISYDRDSNSVDVTYDGTSYTFDLDDLYKYYYNDESDSDDSDSRHKDDDDEDEYEDYYDYYTRNYERDYGYGTGYDTEEDRDYYYNMYDRRTTANGYYA